MGNSNSQSDDDERTKTDSSTDPYIESSADVDSSHYDVIVLGRAGMGKSSTVDKLMVLNFQDLEHSALPGLMKKQKLHIEPEPVKRALSLENKNMDKRNLVEYGNLRSILLSNDKEEIENTQERIMNIVTSRKSGEEPHKHIDKLREDQAQTGVYVTSNCQLFENTDSKIRVLDPPGFYRQDLMKGATSTGDSNLIIVRQIFHMQVVEGLKFDRVLYFLPENGPLLRAERALQEEIHQLVKFFGSSIFKCMVLVATMPPHISRDSELSSERKFPQDQLDLSRRNFQETLVKEFKQRKMPTTELPNPPIIFIAMTDKSEEILEKVKSAPVENDVPFRLNFNRNTCSKCNIEIGINDDGVKVCEYWKPDNILWANAFAYDETSCHPKFETKSKTTFSVTGFWRKLIGKSKSTRCVHCNREPGSPGCYKVHDAYPDGSGRIITVKHTSLSDE